MSKKLGNGEWDHEVGDLIHLQLKSPFKTSLFCDSQLLNLPKCPFFPTDKTTQDLTCGLCYLDKGQHRMVWKMMQTNKQEKPCDGQIGDNLISPNSSSP